MDPGREWTAIDLVEEARARGYSKVSKRQIVDWTELGLIDSPRRRPTGRGSAPAVWTANQAELFFILLDKRRSGVRRMATLCNVPVFVWRGWGEEYVPIRQVRKALRTYSEQYSTASGRASTFTAKEFFRAFGITKPTPIQRDALDTVLTRLASQPRSELGTLRDQLGDALKTAIGPQSSGPDKSLVEDTLWAINCRLAAAASLRDHTDEHRLPDQVFRSAQVMFRQNTDTYVNSTAAPWDALGEIANNACVSLLFELGRTLTTPLPPSATRNEAAR